MNGWKRGISVCFGLWFLASMLLAQTSVTTHHYDNYRTGWNKSETVLTPSNVWAPNFGLLHTVALDDQVDAQPLVMSEISITAGNYQGKHDVVYVVTENNTVYAVDAGTGTVLLTTHLGSPVPLRALPGQCNNNGPNVGITSTPVIDPENSTLYVMAYTNDGPTYRLHALDLSSLKDRLTPKVVAASQDLSPSGKFDFNAKYQRQRSALLLANGNIYAAFASFCDAAPSLSRGWVLGWNEDTLQPVGAELFDSQESDHANFYLSSVWMSGSGPAADDDGNILVVTGNSDNLADTYNGITNIQESVVKLSSTLTQVLDVFTPSNQWNLDQVDGDFGSGGVMIIPQPPGLTMPLAVAVGKDGRMYLMNEQALGGHSPTTNNVLGVYAGGSCFCVESYYTDPSDGLVRVVSSGGVDNQLQIWRLETTPAPAVKRISGINLGASVQDPGFFTSVSSNGTAHPLIWAISRPKSTTSPQLDLWAFDPESGGTIPTNLLNTPAGTWPNVGGNANLVPVVANGHVYVASHEQLQIFGLTANHVRVEATATSATSVSCSSTAQSPWSNPGAASSPGLSFASSAISVTASGSTNSQCLDATGFKFTIPTTAKILGVQVSVIADKSNTSSPVDFNAHLLSNGKEIGTSRSFAVSSYANRYIVGAWNNPWDPTLTPAQINESGFGVAIQASLATSTTSNATVHVDNVQITLFYAP